MMESTAPRRFPIGGVLAGLGGVLAIVGSLLTWATVDTALFGESSSQAISGTEGGDGTITLVLGIIMLIGGIVLLIVRAGGLRRAAAVLAILAGLGTAGIGIYDMVDIKSNALDELISEFGGDPDTITAEQRAQIEQAFDISVGYGLYVVIAGGAIGLIGGILGLRGGPAEPTAAAASSPPPATATDTGFSPPPAAGPGTMPPPAAPPPPSGTTPPAPPGGTAPPTGP